MYSQNRISDFKFITEYTFSTVVLEQYLILKVRCQLLPTTKKLYLAFYKIVFMGKFKNVLSTIKKHKIVSV